MKISDQVCTQEQSKRLQGLGITAPATFSYVKGDHHSAICLTDIASRHLTMLSGQFYIWEEIEMCPAYNVAELGVMLPEKIKMGRLDGYHLQYHRTEEPFGEDRPLWFSSPIINGLYGNPAHTTEAIMKADLLIYLIENNHITADEANKRLEL